MRKLLIILCMLPILAHGQEGNLKTSLKKTFKFATFYGAVNGGNSISDVDIYSVTNGLETEAVRTPFDYSIALGVRKIARFGYENRANTFYNGTENSFSDAANIGKISGFEFLFEADYRRQQGVNYLDQQHFLRYVADNYIVKIEYVQDGFADVEYFESSQRYRHKLGKKLSVNIGAAQRISEPYGYDPLAKWLLSNGNLHYTELAIQEGYSVTFDGQGGIEYFNPAGTLVSENTEVWEAVVMPVVLSDYAENERNKLPQQWNHSLVVGFDYYHYTKDFWLHSWGNVMPYHIDVPGEFTYHKFVGGNWIDYSGGLIFGYKVNKHLGCFVEGKYNKYWNRNWHDFSFGVNYVIF